MPLYAKRSTPGCRHSCAVTLSLRSERQPSCRFMANAHSFARALECLFEPLGCGTYRCRLVNSREKGHFKEFLGLLTSYAAR
jgi:hypothetical protein